MVRYRGNLGTELRSSTRKGSWIEKPRLGVGQVKVNRDKNLWDGFFFSCFNEMTAPREPMPECQVYHKNLLALKTTQSRR